MFGSLRGNYQARSPTTRQDYHNTNPDMSSEQSLPWEDVEASRRNRLLQAKHPVVEGKRRYLAEAKPCPSCQTAPDALSWFYFRSPKETWPAECGVEGWMAICDRCHTQVNFFIEAVS